MSLFKGLSSFGQTGKAPVMQWSWERNRGESEQIFVCGSYEYLKDVKAPELMLDYDNIQIVQDKGDMYKLVAAKTGEEWQNIHEVQGSNLSQSVLINRVLKPQFITQLTAAGVSAATAESTYASIVSRIADEVTKKKSNAQTYAEMASAVSTIGSNTQIAFDLMDHLDRNGEQYLAEQYVYRHTVVMPDRPVGDLGYIFNNTHRVFTEAGTGGLRSAEEIPDDFPLPPSTLDNTVSAEWLKQPVHYSTTVGIRRQVVLEYLFADDWSALLYSNAS